ncbi:MAG: hypothetical protein HYU66_24710, partial [Armatimonadetes bacterium]|nr:hypothetical protein [Armatimonadota bacterium]
MCVSVLTMAVCMAAGAQADWTVDHRYAPVTWQTCLGLPDDWQKTLVGNDGALLYDYPGPFADFSIRLLCGAAEPAEFVNQSLLDPRVPIVRTVRRRGELTCTEEAFAVAPRPAVAEAKAPGLERIGPPDVIPGHARPAAACLPAFRDIAVGWNRPIQYRFHCEPGGRYTVVFGLCEGWWGEAGHRIQVLTAEGAEPSTVDLAATPGQNQPAVYRFEAEDRDRDGRLDLTVAAAPEATDTNTVLSALWVFAPGQAPSDADLIAGRATGSLDFVACGSAAPAGPPRHDLLLVRWHNAGAAAARVAPTLTIQSTLPPEADGDRRLRLGPDSAVSFAAPVTLVAAGDRQWTVALTPIDLPPGGEALVPILVARGRAVLDVPCRLDDALDWRRRAERYWRDADLPYGRIRVPDAGIQAQLDSAVRNIYQAREIKQDLPAFQVGPTCYRGLWVVDG